MEATKSNQHQYDPVEIIEDVNDDLNASKVNRYHAMFTNIINKNNTTAKPKKSAKPKQKEETSDDLDEDNPEEPVKSSGSHQKRQISNASLKKYHCEDPLTLEIGVDEAGRGPLFGRVYSGAVILPKDDTFDHSLMKDSKKFHSKKKIAEVAEYIKTNAIAWGVGYCTEQTIDDINILQATQQSMHKAIAAALKKVDHSNVLLLVDGNYFKPYTHNTHNSNPTPLPYTTVEGGDNTYTSIAAASILAKVARDDYIDELCGENPELEAHYGIASNKGYGAKRHIDGIKEHGITIWHRRSFGICKQY